MEMETRQSGRPGGKVGGRRLPQLLEEVDWLWDDLRVIRDSAKEFMDEFWYSPRAIQPGDLQRLARVQSAFAANLIFATVESVRFSLSCALSAPPLISEFSRYTASRCAEGSESAHPFDLPPKNAAGPHEREGEGPQRPMWGTQRYPTQTSERERMKYIQLLCDECVTSLESAVLISHLLLRPVVFSGRGKNSRDREEGLASRRHAQGGAAGLGYPTWCEGQWLETTLGSEVPWRPEAQCGHGKDEQHRAAGEPWSSIPASRTTGALLDPTHPKSLWALRRHCSEVLHLYHEFFYWLRASSSASHRGNHVGGCRVIGALGDVPSVSSPTLQRSGGTLQERFFSAAAASDHSQRVVASPLTSHTAAYSPNTTSRASSGASRASSKDCAAQEEKSNLSARNMVPSTSNPKCFAPVPTHLSRELYSEMNTPVAVVHSATLSSVQAAAPQKGAEARSSPSAASQQNPSSKPSALASSSSPFAAFSFKTFGIGGESVVSLPTPSTIGSIPASAATALAAVGVPWAPALAMRQRLSTEGIFTAASSSSYFSGEVHTANESRQVNMFTSQSQVANFAATPLWPSTAPKSPGGNPPACLTMCVATPSVATPIASTPHTPQVSTFSTFAAGSSVAVATPFNSMEQRYQLTVSPPASTPVPSPVEARPQKPLTGDLVPNAELPDEVLEPLGKCADSAVDKEGDVEALSEGRENASVSSMRLSNLQLVADAMVAVSPACTTEPTLGSLLQPIVYTTDEQTVPVGGKGEDPVALGSGTDVEERVRQEQTYRNAIHEVDPGTISTEGGDADVDARAHHDVTRSSAITCVLGAVFLPESSATDETGEGAGAAHLLSSPQEFTAICAAQGLEACSSLESGGRLEGGQRSGVVDLVAGARSSIGTSIPEDDLTAASPCSFETNLDVSGAVSVADAGMTAEVKPKRSLGDIAFLFKQKSRAT